MNSSKWKPIKLKYAYHFSIGFTPNTSNLSYYENGVYSWAQISDLTSKVLLTTQKKITLQAITDYQPTLAPKNSLLVSFLLSPGVTSFCGIDTYFNQAIACFPPTNKNSLNYLSFILPYVLKSVSRVNIYGALIYTSTLLKNILIPLPPLEQQKSIASFLDQQSTLIQQLFSKIDWLLKKLEEYKEAIFHEILISKNKKYSPIKLKYLLLGIKDGEHGSVPSIEKNDSAKLFLSAKNISSFSLLITDHERYISLEDYNHIISNGYPKKGDVLCSCVGVIHSCLFLEQTPLAFQRSVVFLRTNSSYLLNSYLVYLLNTSSFKQNFFQKSYTIQQFNYLSDFKNLFVSLPPLLLQ